MSCLTRAKLGKNLVVSLAAALVWLIVIAGSTRARAAEIYSSTTTLAQSGSVASSPFTLFTTTTLVSRVVSDYAVDGGIFTPTNFNAFANGQATSGWAIFSSQNGALSVTLAPGNYVVAVRNRSNTANTTRFELDEDHSIAGESRIDSQTEVTSVSPNGGTLVQPFTIPSGQSVYIDGANTGLEFYMIPSSEISKFQNNQTFSYYTSFGSGEDTSQPGGYSVNLPPGSYALAFRNNKAITKRLTYTIEWWTDGGGNPNPVTAPSITNHPSSQSVAEGQTSSFSVTASGTSPFAYQWRKNGVSIPGATSSSYSIPNVNSTHAGSYSVVVSNSAGSATSNSATLSVNPPSSTFSAASIEATNLSWTTGGNASWVSQTAKTHDGVDAARSGAIGDSQNTWIQTTVTGPGVISFWWCVSSESSYDFLEFVYDGAVQTGAISGETGWTQPSFNIPAGTHTLQWRYRKDISGATGSDAGWVDQISWTPTASLPVFTGASNVPGTFGQAFSHTIPFTNSPSSYGVTSLPTGLNLNTTTGQITGTPTEVGTFPVYATATNAAGSGSGSFTIQIVKASQSITFATPPNKQTTDGPFSLVASSSASLPVSFSVLSGPASVSGSTVTLTGAAGTVTIRASQAGNANYNAAVAVDRSFEVSSAFETFLANAGVPIGQRGDSDDPDRDGISNLLEYALGGNPALAARTILPTFAPPSAANGQKMVFKYRRNLAATGVTCVAQHSTTLSAPWSAAVHGQSGVTISSTTLDATTEEVTVTISSAGTTRFIRLSATR